MLKASPGFTLVELLISISILSGMTYISVQKFKTSSRTNFSQRELRESQQSFAKAQNLAQSGKQTQYPLANGYGVRIGRPQAQTSRGRHSCLSISTQVTPCARIYWDSGSGTRRFLRPQLLLTDRSTRPYRRISPQKISS